MTTQVSINDRKHYQIFISSTFADLQQERKKAVEVVVNRGHMPIALEGFSASNKSDLEVIEEAIKDCQVYILILGHRYGELVHDQCDRQISYTELEFEIAEKNGLLILPFILKDEEINARRKKLDANSTRDQLELENYQLLCRFHERIKKFFFRPWGPEDEFKYLVATALDDHLRECDKPAFVLEPDEPIRDLLQSACRNEFFVHIVKQLSGFEKLDKRCSQEPDKKQALACYFREKYIDRILANKVSLFFESGSTVAYVARELSQPLSDAFRAGGSGQPTIQLSTNNVLAYLQLWMNAKVPCTLFPWGPPDETYGASYGSIAHIERLSPDYTLPTLNDVAIAEIQKLLGQQYTLLSMPRPILLLGAASGLQLGEDYTIKFRPEDEPRLNDQQKSVVRQQLAKCRGPHAGSYHNKIFKRFMYDTKIPLIIFITGEKIGFEIVAGKCHFILDREFTWEQFYQNHPLAFCVGCAQDEREKYIDVFRDLGFEIYEGNNFSAITAFIARNARFIEDFEIPTSKTSL